MVVDRKPKQIHECFKNVSKFRNSSKNTSSSVQYKAKHFITMSYNNQGKQYPKYERINCN